MSKGRIALLSHDARHHETLMDFLNYCHEHPDERFWQALRNWSGMAFICAAEEEFITDFGWAKDTFNWEGRNK